MAVDASGSLHLQQVTVTDAAILFAVVLDGRELGEVSLSAYYKPAFQLYEKFVALWAGATLCVINREHGTMQCIRRDDETHGVIAFEDIWILEGELSIELFDPATLTATARYGHHEVIMSCSLHDHFVHLEDFNGDTVTLDASRALHIVEATSSSEDRAPARTESQLRAAEAATKSRRAALSRGLFIAAVLLFVVSCTMCMVGPRYEVSRLPAAQREQMTDTDWIGAEWVFRSMAIEAVAILLAAAGWWIKPRTRVTPR